MKLPVIIQFTKLEIAFLVVAFAVLIGGVVICVQLHDAGWMPGVGAIMIVLGVMFALFDLRDILELKADKWARLRKELTVQSRIDAIEEETHSMPSDAELIKIRREGGKEADKRLPSHGPKIRKRFLFVEAFMVCLGTLVNGFGQNIIVWYLS